MKFNFRRFPPNKLVLKVTSVVLQVLLLVGLVAVIGYTIASSVLSFSQGPLALAFAILENSLLVVVFIEVYLSVVDFFEGRGRSLIYVLDATVSFLAREIIIDVLTGPSSFLDILELSGAVGVIATSRFMLNRKRLRRPKKHH
ncbi:MAG: phosphate-starvation-inducible PsiE family protein [Candidatus Aramenus sp.]|jgi:uncharacterized membrane protein (DUF373 family)|nr:phosphate-starvation-inducible PsiE family protein [Candidatus Aramenus sp.]